jgi:tetratricopeptide (TPR) repeat protein
VLELLAAKLGCTVGYLVNGVTDAEVQRLEGDIRQARMALENGRVEQAQRRFSALVANDTVQRFDGLRQEAEFGLARSIEAGGDSAGSIPILRGLLDRPGRGMAMSRRVGISIALTRCLLGSQDLGGAIEFAEGTLAELGKEGWTDDLMELASTLLSCYYERGDTLRAEQFAAELLAAADKLGSPRAIVAANWNAATHLDIAGRGDEALPLIERAMAVQEEFGEPRNLARLRLQYAFILLRNRPEDAALCRDLLLRAEQEIRESSASTADLGLCFFYLARAEIVLQDIEAAAEYSRRGFVTMGRSNADAQADAHLLLGREYLRLARSQEAAVEVKAAIELLDTLPPTRQNSECWFEAANLMEKLGDDEGSRAAYQRAMEGGGV